MKKLPQRKDEMIGLRLPPRLMPIVKLVAEAKKTTSSKWARAVVLAALEIEMVAMRAAGAVVPDVEPEEIEQQREQVSNSEPSTPAQDQRPDLQNMIPTEPQTSKSWAEVFAVEKEDARRIAFNSFLGGRPLHPSWSKATAEQRIKWLDKEYPLT